MGWVEDKKVLLTIFISVVALLAPTSSAVAAFLSWRTAQASEAVTRHAADTAGSILTINPIARLTGMCGADYDPLHIEVSVQNYGRLAGRILNLRLFVWMITPDGYRSTVVASAHSGPVEVAAMDSATASLQIDCDGLGRMMMTNPKNLVDGQPSVGLLLQSGMGDTFVEVQYPLRTSVHFPLEQVSR
ncbi:hypothetical protein FZI91_14695 [Mycobacterium sp. CBMA271]|uniref:hypothetical protein n=1 Tax=unclassified Mycobacteroides TaxID=2618759 RepID=UPI0013264654|nr:MULTISPECIES: hypothetical protein [unclassified Mycobacteroides]MUM17779.1 hypothetical protein [Mycobacteroides sp. CBMA 326]MUM22947.1 hypothetical protein [Mycobacteroides sp. CBMA 271]